MNWGRRSRSNTGPQRNFDQLLRRLNAIEGRLYLDESNEEYENLRNVASAVDPMEILIEAMTKQLSKVKVYISDFKGEINPDLFLDWVQELEKYFKMED
ncbi:hypothetical protein SUGI_0263630 [Cryptomeria japonica]|nr:hypothetical protein SUGI_0263630 [Cryptomeria japonica]